VTRTECGGMSGDAAEKAGLALLDESSDGCEFASGKFMESTVYVLGGCKATEHIRRSSN